MIGGSADLKYCSALASLEKFSNGNIRVVNIDAHSDARPLRNGKVHSGSPFVYVYQQPKFPRTDSMNDSVSP